MRITVLAVPGCPNAPVAAGRITAALAGRPVSVELVEVTGEAEAARLGMTGSPTIRIAGRDIDPPEASARYVLTCRAYRLPDGRITPFPPKELIRAALRDALASPDENSEGGPG